MAAAWTRYYRPKQRESTFMENSVFHHRDYVYRINPIAPSKPVPVIHQDKGINQENPMKLVVDTKREIHVSRNPRFLYLCLFSSFGLLMMTACLSIAGISLYYSLDADYPTGTVFIYSGKASTLTANNDKWLFCDGSAVSRTRYRGLFELIGTRYGAGNGVDTFNLPDLRSQFLIGTNYSTTTQMTSGGAAQVALTIANMPAHTHSQGTLSTLSSGSHSHSVSDPGHNHGGATGAGMHGSGSASFWILGFSSEGGTHTHSIPWGSTSISIDSNGAHTHTLSGTTGSVGIGTPFDVLPPHLIMHYVVRT